MIWEVRGKTNDTVPRIWHAKYQLAPVTVARKRAP